MPDLSIVVPLYNEAESLPELERWIRQVCTEHKFDYEVIFVDDGSTDGSWRVLEDLSSSHPQNRCIKFRRNYGKSAALDTAFKRCRGNVVITMDADLQDSPDEIPALYDMVMNQGYDLVSGWKRRRYDPISKTLPSRFFNKVTRMMSKIDLHDFNCGLKAYKLEVVQNIDVYGEMHRYIPVIAKWSGFQKIGEKEVEHRSRKYGVSKFGLERFINGFLDLLTIFFVGKFGKKPMHFFGTLGTLSFFLGLLILVYLSIEKLFFQVGGIATRPLFYFGILTVILGAQLFLTGFLAELIARNNLGKDQYQIEKELGR